MQSLWEHIHSTIYTRQAIEQSGTGARSKRNRDKDDHEHGEEEHEIDERRYGGLGASLTVLSAGMGVESFAAESIGAAVNGFIRSRYEVGESEETETKVHSTSTCAKAGFESLSESATSRAQPTLAAASQDPIACFVLVPSFQGGTATRRAGAALQKALNHRELMTRGRLNVIKRSETPQQKDSVDEPRVAHALGHRKSSFSPSMLAACTSLVIDASTHFECVLIQEGMDPKERCRGYFGKFAGGADNSTTTPASASKQKVKHDAIRFELFQSENVVFDAEETGGGGAGAAHVGVTVRVVLLPARTFCTDLLHKRIPIDTAVPIVLTMVRNVDEFFSPEDQESFRLDREDSGGAMRSGLAAHRASVVPLSRISSSIPPLAFALEMCSDSQFRQRQIIEAFVDRKTIHRKMKAGRAAAAMFERNSKQDKDTSSRDRRNNHKSEINELGANDDGSSSNNSNENARLLKDFFSELAHPPVPPPAPLLYPLIRIVTDSASVSTSLLCSNPRRLSALHVLDKLKLHDGADALQLFPRFRLDVINYFESEEKKLRLMAAGSVESSGTSASPKASKMPALCSSSSAPSPPLSIKLKVETPPLPLSMLSPFSARIATLLYTILEDLVLDLKREMNAMERRLSEEIHNRLLQRMFSSDAAAEDNHFDGGAKKAVGGSWRDALRTKKLQGGFFRLGDDSDTEDLATHGTANLVAGPAWDVSNNTNSKKSAAGALIGRNPSSSNGGAAVREPKAPKIVVSVKGIALGSLSAFDLIAIPGLVVDGKSQSEAKEAENGAIQGEARKERAHRNPSGKNVDENEDNDDGDDGVIEVAKKTTNGAPLSSPQPSSTFAVGDNAPKLRTAADTAATAAVAHNSAILLAELRAMVDKSSLPVVDHNDYYNLLGVTNSHNRTHFSPSASNSAFGNFPHQGPSRTSYLTQRPTLPMAVIAILRSILDVRDFFDFLVSTPDMPATTFLYKLERKLLAYRRLEYAFAIEMRWRSMHDPSMWAQIHPSVMGCNGVQLWTLSPHFAEVCALARQRVYITHENEWCSVPVSYRHHQQERQTATATEPAGLNNDTLENSAHAQQPAHSSSSSSSLGVRGSGGGRSILITPNLSEEVGPRLHWLRQAVDDWARKQAENYLKTVTYSSYSLSSSSSHQKKRGGEGFFPSSGGGKSVSAMPSLLVLCQRRASIRQITDLFNEGIEAVARRKFCGFLADYKHLHTQHEALGAYQQEQHEERTSASAAVSTTLNYSAKGGVLAASGSGGSGFGFGRGRGQQRGCGRGACNSRGARGAMSGPHKSPRADALSASNINKPLFGYSGGEGNTTKSTPSKFTGLSSAETSSKITPTGASHSTLKPPGVAMPATVVLCDSSDDDDAFDGFVGGEFSSKTTTPAYDENAFLFVNQSGSASGATASKPKRTLLFGGGRGAAEDKSSASGDQNDEGNNVPASNTDGEGGDHQSTTTKLVSVVPSASDESETDSLVEVLVQTKPNRNRNEIEASSPNNHHDRTDHQQRRAMEEEEQHQQHRRLVVARSILAAAPSSSLFDDDDDRGRRIDGSGSISGRMIRSRFVDREKEIGEEDGANANSNKGKRGQQKKKKGEESGFGLHVADSEEEGSDTDAASDFDWESPTALEVLNKNDKVAARRSKSTSKVVKGGQKRARSESPNPALPAALLGREKSAGPSAPQLLENCFDLTGSRIDDIRESIISLTQLDDLHIYASNNGTILTTEDVSTEEEWIKQNQQQSELANANSAGNATQQSILQCRGRSLSAYAAGIVSQVLCSSKSRSGASTTPQRRRREYSVRQPDEELASQLTPIWGIVSALTAIAPPPSSGNEREGGLNVSAAPPPLPPPIIRFRPKQPAAPTANAPSNNDVPSFSSSFSSTSTAPNEKPQPIVIRSNLGVTSTSSSLSSIEGGGGVRRTLIGGLATKHGTTTTAATTAVLKARQAHESLLALHDVGIMALASRPATAGASPTVAGASSFSSSSHSSLISDALASATGNGKVKASATSEKAVVVNRNELDLLRFLAEGTSTSDSSPYNQGIGVLSKLLADPTTSRVEILEKALFCSSSSASETTSSSASQVRARATQLSSNNNPFDNIANDENHKSTTVVNLSQATDLGDTTEDLVGKGQRVPAISLPQHPTTKLLGDNVIDLGQRRIPSSVLHVNAHVLNRADGIFEEGSSTTKAQTTTRATVLMSAAPRRTATPQQRGVVEILDSDEDGDDALEILTPATRKEVAVERPQSPTHVLCDASVTYALQSVGQDAAVICVKLVLVESLSMSIDTETVEGKTKEVRGTQEMKGRVAEIIVATIRVSLNANVTCASMVELLSDQRFVPYTEEDTKEKCDKKESVTAEARRNGNIGNPPPSTAPRIRDPTRSRVDKLILFEPEASLLKTIEVVGVELRRKALLFASTVSITKTTVEDDDDDDDEIHEVRQSKKKDHNRTLESRPMLYLAPEARKAIEVSVFQWRPPAAPKKPSAKGVSSSASYSVMPAASTTPASKPVHIFHVDPFSLDIAMAREQILLQRLVVAKNTTLANHRMHVSTASKLALLQSLSRSIESGGGGGSAGYGADMNNNDTAKAYTTTIPNSGTTNGPDNNKKPRDTLTRRIKEAVLANKGSVGEEEQEQDEEDDTSSEPKTINEAWERAQRKLQRERARGEKQKDSTSASSPAAAADSAFLTIMQALKAISARREAQQCLSLSASSSSLLGSSGFAASSNQIDRRLLVVMDEREFRNNLPYELHVRGISLLPMTLPRGDFILSPTCAVERKSFPDLVGSLASSRLNSQLTKLTEHFAHTMVLIEDSDFTEETAGSSAAVRPFRFHHSSSASESGYTHSFAMANIYRQLMRLVMLHRTVHWLWGRSAGHSATMITKMKCGESFSSLPTAGYQREPQQSFSRLSERIAVANPDPDVCAPSGRDEGQKDSQKVAMSVLARFPGVTAANIAPLMLRCRSLAGLAVMSREEITEALTVVPSQSHNSNNSGAVASDAARSAAQFEASVNGELLYNFLHTKV